MPPGAWGSADGHHAADSCLDDVELADATVALMSYNIGINNNEPNNKMNWAVTYRELWDTSIVARAWLECVIPPGSETPSKGASMYGSRALCSCFCPPPKGQQQTHRLRPICASPEGLRSPQDRKQPHNALDP